MCEVPCVVTHVGDSSEIVGNGGKVIDHADPSALSSAWQEILNENVSKWRTIMPRHRNSLKDRYGYDLMIDRTLVFLSEAYHRTAG